MDIHPKHLYTPVEGTPMTKEMEGQHLPDALAPQRRGANGAGWGPREPSSGLKTFIPMSSTPGHLSSRNK